LHILIDLDMATLHECELRFTYHVVGDGIISIPCSVCSTRGEDSPYNFT